MPQHIETVQHGDREASFRIWYDDPEKEDPLFGQCGLSVACRFDIEPAALKRVIHRALLPDAYRVLKPGTIFEIRGKSKPIAGRLSYRRGMPGLPANEVANWGIAWYHLPSMHNSSEVARQALWEFEDHRTLEDNPLGGYLMLALMRTPDGPSPT